MAMPARAVLIGSALLALGCTDVEDGGERAADEPVPADSAASSARPPLAVDSVDVVFTRGEQPVTVRRPAREDRPALRTALEELLAGPTAAERGAGIESWFSGLTADALRSAEVDAAGHAIVDFADLAALIPNAASSTGSAMLLTELNGTVFGIPEVRSVEYRIDGSCDAFWDWLQYGCQIVQRPTS